MIILYRSTTPFLRTIPLRGVPVDVSVPTLFRGLVLNGEAQGGGALDRAASQSKGTEEEIEGVSAGERCIGYEGLGRGVVGRGPFMKDPEGV